MDASPAARRYTAKRRRLREHAENTRARAEHGGCYARAIVTPLQLGSTLLRKYRIDRFRKRKDGVLLYEGIDASRLRRVCVKVLERAAVNDAVRCARFHDEAHAANVIDIGTCEGLPYFVTTDCELAPPRPKPPPLPKPASSKPPPLPKPKPPPDIPIFVDEDALLMPAPSISYDLALEPRRRVRASWFLLVAVTALAASVGWYVSSRSSSEDAPTSPPETIAARPLAATASEKPPAPHAIETVTAPPAVSSAPPKPSKPQPLPTVDPLTI